MKLSPRPRPESWYGHTQEALATRTMGMPIGATQRTFYELRAMKMDRLVHCLIELEHPELLDPWLGWLQASVQARKALQRMPTPEELCQVTEKVAHGLAKTVSLTRRHKRQGGSHKIECACS